MTGDAADLLLACARVRTEAGPAARPSDVPDWAALLDAADFHNLLPLLYWSIGRGPADLADSTTANPITNPISNPITRLPTHQITRFAGVVPEDIAHRLHQAYVASAKRTLFLTVNLAELIVRFDEERIPVIALKGPPLAEWLYADPALRPSFDLDLLIRPADVPAALALLAREGYRREPYLERLPLKALLEFNCEALVRHEGRAPIELHWAVAPDDFPFRFDAGILWRSRRTARIGGQDVSVLAPGCLLMYLCVHGAKHAWSRLIWFADVARLVDRGVDWQEALALAAEARCERPFFLGLLLAHELLDTVVPEAILDRARADPIVLSTARETAQRLRRVPPFEPSSTARTAYNARLAPRTVDKIRHWAAMFKAPKQDDLEQWNLPTWLFFLYYPLRVQRLAVKYARRLMGTGER